MDGKKKGRGPEDLFENWQGALNETGMRNFCQLADFRFFFIQGYIHVVASLPFQYSYSLG